MDGPTHSGRREPVLLWKIKDVSCTCQTFDVDDIEVALALGDVVIHRERFTDPDEASQYAIDTMRSYQGL
jgi:hypothetical protein